MIEFLHHFGALSEEDPRVKKVIDRGVNAQPSGWGDSPSFFLSQKGALISDIMHHPTLAVHIMRVIMNVIIPM